MKKKVRLNNDKVKKIVTEKLRQDGTFVHESKIDLAIKKYLIERQDNTGSDETESVMSFSSEANHSFEQMIEGLYEIVEDLEIIKTKESDVLVDTHPEETYSETYLTEVIMTIEQIIDGLEYLRGLEDEKGNYE